MPRLHLESQKRASCSQHDTTPAPAPIQVTCGAMLCRLCVWTEEEWAALGEAERPMEYTHAPGLGWIGAVPICSTN